MTWVAAPLRGQGRIEWQMQGIGVVTGSEFAGAGLGVGVRTRGRLRFGLTGSVGGASGRLAGRGEAMLSYHANPARRRGATPYLAGGMAVTVTEPGTTEYLVLVLGVETAPAGRLGWFVEVGAAGGLRVSTGFRVRRRGR